MTIDPSLITNKYPCILDPLLGNSYKERSLSQNNLLNRSQSHKTIKLFHNKFRMDPKWKHTQNTFTHNNHYILYDMDLFDIYRIFKISDKAILFLLWDIDQLSNNCFRVMYKKYHNSLLIPPPTDFDIEIDCHLKISGT